MTVVKNLLISLTAIVSASTGWAASPAVAYTEAGKFDSSFNEAVYREGVSPFQSHHRGSVEEAFPKSPEEYVSILSRLAEKGRSPIVAVGFSYAAAIETVASQYPKIQFVLIDAAVNLPNVQSILFKEHEGSFLVGAVAAIKSKSNNFGFVGGVDGDFIHRFGCGYAQGVHYVNSSARVHARYVSSNTSGFNNIARGEELGEELINKGAKVIFAAAGTSGNGVYDAAARYNDVYAIGVDSNQNYFHVGTMLTSMVKKVGVAALHSWEEALQGKWSGGIKTLGIAEDGVDWQLDIFNRNLISKSDEKKINKIRDDIISGKIKVVDSLKSGSCPVQMITN
jgi:basic membrane protein A